MAKQITTEKVRTEIAGLIRLCRWGARSLYGGPLYIRQKEESIRTLQDLCDALGFTVPTVDDPDLGLRMVKGVYRGRRPHRKA